MKHQTNVLTKNRLITFAVVIAFFAAASLFMLFRSVRYQALVFIVQSSQDAGTEPRTRYFWRTGIESIDKATLKVALAIRVISPVHTVHLSEPSSDGITALAAFPELRCLAVSGSTFDPTSLRVLENLPQLETLYLSNYEKDAEEALRFLRHCPLLRRLFCWTTLNIRGEFFDELTCEQNLQEIEIWGDITDFDDDDLLRLRRFQKLKSVSIEFGRFTGEGFRVFGQLPELEGLAIDIPNEDAKKHLHRIPNVTDLE